LVPLDRSLLNPKTLNRTDLLKIRNAEIARKLLKEMMTTKCPGELPVKKKRKPKFWVGLGDLVLEPVFEVGLGKLEFLDWDENIQAWVNEEGMPVYEKDWKAIKPLKVGLGELILEEERTTEEVKTNGLQTVINNGLEAIGTVKNFIKGLFD